MSTHWANVYEEAEKHFDGFQNNWHNTFTPEEMLAFLQLLGVNENLQGLSYAAKTRVGLVLVARAELGSVQLVFPRMDKSFMIAFTGSELGLTATAAIINCDIQKERERSHFSPVARLFHQINVPGCSAWEYFGVTLKATGAQLDAVEAHAKLIARMFDRILEDA